VPELAKFSEFEPKLTQLLASLDVELILAAFGFESPSYLLNPISTAGCLSIAQRVLFGFMPTSAADVGSKICVILIVAPAGDSAAHICTHSDSHAIVAATLVGGGSHRVLPLDGEALRNSAAQHRQSCESSAANRAHCFRFQMVNYNKKNSNATCEISV
jgi:hypothetical protein